MNIQTSLYIDQSPSTVFRWLADLEKLPEWEESFAEVRRQAEGPLLVAETYWCRRKFPKTAESSMKITEYEAGRKMMVEGEWVGFLKPVFGFVVEPSTTGTKATLIAHTQLRGPMRLLSPLLTIMGKRLSARYLQNFKQLVEKE